MQATIYDQLGEPEPQQQPTERLDGPTEAQVIAGAQAMHTLFEQRQERRDPFYTRQRWDQIGEKCQREFVDYVRPALNAAWRVE